MKAAIIIPARTDSWRFPRKLHKLIGNRSVLEVTYKNARRARSVYETFIAAGDADIYELAKSFCPSNVHVPAVLPIRNGTERVAKAAWYLEHIFNLPWWSLDIIVNVQADEVGITGEAIDLLVEFMQENLACQVGTLGTKLLDGDIDNENVVKVVFDGATRVQEFTRMGVEDASAAHIGVYAIRYDVLMKYASLPIGRVEIAENLEQWRWMENGVDVHCLMTDAEHIAINVPGDIDRYRSLFA